jgi:catechol 2,3-dioxygenase-like lactoylglutathione lyase family enzyme
MKAGETQMVQITGVAHFAIPVSDPDKSTRFYTEVVGCKFLSALPDQSMTFLDAGGVCLLLIKRPPPAPIVRELEYSNGVHHAFMITESEYQAALDNLRANGVEIFFEEDRRTGVIRGPRAYFRDPDGTALEYIYRTGYGGTNAS